MYDVYVAAGRSGGVRVALKCTPSNIGILYLSERQGYGSFSMSFFSAHTYPSPVFKKPGENKKSAPSDPAGFWKKSVKFSKNRTKSI
jgi:hypothetical protein